MDWPMSSEELKAKYPDELNGWRYRVETDHSVSAFGPEGRPQKFADWQTFWTVAGGRHAKRWGSTILFGVLGALILVGGIIGMAMGPQSMSIAPPPPGAVRIHSKLVGCPYDWQAMQLIVLAYNAKNDPHAFFAAVYKYNCKIFDPPVDVWVDTRQAGLACVRPRGEPECLWTADDEAFGSN
jgi:hypothetical protein